MRTLSIRAVPLTQGDHRLFVGSMKARDITEFTAIDRFDPKRSIDHPDQGYQREAEPPRFKKYANFLIKEADRLAPSAILLSSRTALRYDPSTGMLTVTSDAPLQIVDGQHRVEGMRYAIDEKRRDELKSFEVPVVIIEGLNRFQEMRQFAVVNGTAKSVRTDLVNMILTKRVAALGDEAVKPAEQWKVVVSRVVERVNTTPGSPWLDRIVMPSDHAPSDAERAANRALANVKIVRATSFMSSLKPIYDYLDDHGFIKGKLVDRAERLAEIVQEYWKAIRTLNPKCFDAPNDYVIQKTPGLFSLHRILHQILKTMHVAKRPWTEPHFKEVLASVAELQDPGYWDVENGDAAKYGSMKGFAELADLLLESGELKA